MKHPPQFRAESTESGAATIRSEPGPVNPMWAHWELYGYGQARSNHIRASLGIAHGQVPIHSQLGWV